MILVTPADVGRPQFARLLRDGIVAPLAAGVARPLDVPSSPGLRALACAHVPRHTVLTGLAALWVYGRWARADGSAPQAPWHVVGVRGLSRTDDARLAFHSGVTSRMGERTGPIRLAPVARACLDALRWEDETVARAATVAGLAAGWVTAPELRASLACDPANGAGYGRVAGIVRELVDGVPVRP